MDSVNVSGGKPDVLLFINRDLSEDEISNRLKTVRLRNYAENEAGSMVCIDDVKPNYTEGEVAYLKTELGEAFYPPASSQAKVLLTKIAEEYGMHTIYAYVYEGELKPGEHVFAIIAGGAAHNLDHVWDAWRRYVKEHMKRKNVYK